MYIHSQATRFCGEWGYTVFTPVHISQVSYVVGDSAKYIELQQLQLMLEHISTVHFRFPLHSFHSREPLFFFNKNAMFMIAYTLIFCHSTLEPDHCTRTAQSSRGGCSRRVHKKVYLAVKKGSYFCQFLNSENIHYV